MVIEDFTAYHREYYHKRRQKIIDFLGGCCVVCGSTEELEFDHIDKEMKIFEINSNVTLSNDFIREELGKCQLLCKPHHKEKTAEENSGFTHGTMYAWMQQKCQCDICLIAKRTWHDDRNEKRRSGSGRGAYGRPSAHGEYLHYKRGCKCDLCKAANTAHVRELRNK